MDSQMTIEQRNLLRLLSASIGSTPLVKLEKMNEQQWCTLIETAKNHAVLSLIYDELIKQPDVNEQMQVRAQEYCKRVVQHNYRLLMMSRYIIDLLKDNGVEAVILKGVATASFYPFFELRKSSDIDILIKSSDMEFAKKLFKKNDFMLLEEQHSLHHIEFQFQNIIIELHDSMAEPVDNSDFNRFMKTIVHTGLKEKEDVSILEISFPTLSPAYHGFYLILHMIQHFLRKGFGVKLLCDWVVFWNAKQRKETKEQFLRFVTQGGLLTFTRTITSICIKYMGLKEENVAFLEAGLVDESDMQLMLDELWDAEEFGHANEHRMVMTKGTSIWHLFLEFHHQMKLNYHKYAKIIILWPVLWIMTFVGFIHNNHKVRGGVKGRDIINNAKKRSKLMRQMKIFIK